MKTKPVPEPVSEERLITLPKLNIQTAIIKLVGDSPLISHAWSQKAKQAMLDKQMKKAKQAKEAKDPEADYKACLYMLPTPNGTPYGFPAIAFKSAAVDACSHVANITKVVARGVFHINNELVPIYGTPRMREDMVRLSGIGNTADIRYRAEFPSWYTQFVIRYNANMITLEQLLNLFNTAGFAIGIGDWRSQKDGSFGMFHVATQEESHG